jgi:DNA gyrase/topoisomerase IV subunit A
MDNRTIEEIRENETKLINELKEKDKEINRLNNIIKNQDRKIKLAIKIFENINKIYGESSSINDVIGVLKEE